MKFTKAGKVHGNTRYGAEDRAKARRLFVQEGKTFAEIAEELGPSHRTVELWCRAEDWREQRRSWIEETGTPLEDLEERAYRKVLSRLDRDSEQLPSTELLALFGALSRYKSLLVKSSGVRLVDAVLAVAPEFEAYILRERQADAAPVLEGWKSFVDEIARKVA